MKRYMLFAGYEYYPSGGMGDFVGYFDTMSEAVQHIQNVEWWHVLDTQRGMTYSDHQVPSDSSVVEWAAQLDPVQKPAGEVMVYQVSGTVCKSEYMVDGETRFTDRKMVKAVCAETAKQKFTQFWEDKTDEYSVYYHVVNVQVMETLK